MTEVGLLLAAAAGWFPGIRGCSFLSDDFGLVQRWGMRPVAQWILEEGGGYYRPLAALSFRTDYLLWRETTAGYYLSHFLLHAGCALLVWWLAARLFPQRRAGVWAGLLFLFLPGHVFAVLWISARADLVCSLFYLGSVALYLHGRAGGKGGELLSLVAFVLALFAKEMAISLPLLIMAWEGIVGRGRFSKWIRVCYPYLLVSSGYLGFRYLLFGALPGNETHSNLALVHLFTEAVRYWATIAVPWGLDGVKPFFRGHPALLVFGAVVAVLLGLGACWYSRRRWQAGHLGCLAWVAITVLPVIQLFSPWTTYLPSAGAAMLFAGLGTSGREPTGESPRRIWLREGVLGLWLCLGVVYSLQTQAHWRHAGQLCARVLEEIARVKAQNPGKLYLANLPVELGEAPVFGGTGHLSSALGLGGQDPDVEALTAVHQAVPDAGIQVSLSGGHKLQVVLMSPDDFFRIEALEVVAKKVTPAVGYTYTQGGMRLVVRGVDPQNQPNWLEVDLGNPERGGQVWVWNRGRLEPLIKE